MLARILILAVVASSGVAAAQPVGSDLEALCRADYERFCPPYEHHRRGLAECIRHHLAQATPACQEEVRAYIRMLREMEASDPQHRHRARPEAYDGTP